MVFPKQDLLARVGPLGRYVTSSGNVIVLYDNANADHAHPTAGVANAIYVWYGKSDGTFAAPVVMGRRRWLGREWLASVILR